MSVIYFQCFSLERLASAFLVSSKRHRNVWQFASSQPSVTSLHVLAIRCHTPRALVGTDNTLISGARYL